MQWNDEENGGFSKARPSRLRRPVVEGRFGPMGVNVATQRRDPASLLSWMERLIEAAARDPELGWGSWKVLRTNVPEVFAHRCDWEGRAVVAAHNSLRVGRAWCGSAWVTSSRARLDDLLDERGALIEIERVARAQDGRVRVPVVPVAVAGASHPAVVAGASDPVRSDGPRHTRGSGTRIRIWS